MVSDSFYSGFVLRCDKKEEMKIGVLSDTHLNRVTPWLQELAETHLQGMDLILHAGDMVSLEVYHYLRQWPVQAVQGNMDEKGLRKVLPVKKTLSLGVFQIGLIHGWGSPWGLEDRLQLEFSGIQCLVYGHSHIPANHRSNGILLFNPGSAAKSGFRRKATIGIIHLNDHLEGEIVEL
jgi:uncharacterized protein